MVNKAPDEHFVMILITSLTESWNNLRLISDGAQRKWEMIMYSQRKSGRILSKGTEIGRLYLLNGRRWKSTITWTRKD